MRINKDSVGCVYPSRKYGDFKVVDYIDCTKVTIEFLLTGYKNIVESVQIKKGAVKDRLCPSVSGIGFMGDGMYTSRNNKGKHTQEYTVWRSILSRCYSKVGRKNNPAYNNCTVDPIWHNYQNFAKWYNENYPQDGKKYHLDKDILINGNKVYSPDFCLFVSQEENNVKAHAKHFKLISPNNEVVKIYNMRKFARENNLLFSNMCSVARGSQSHHKGWKKYKGDSHETK